MSSLLVYHQPSRSIHSFFYYQSFQQCINLSVDGGVFLIESNIGDLGLIDGESLAAQPGIVFGSTLGIGGLLDVDVTLLNLLVQAVELQIDLWGGLAAEGLGLFYNCVELQERESERGERGRQVLNPSQ